MIELTDNELRFSFPEVHKDAHFGIEFQRTLRIPDDGRDYPLPAGLGRFPLEHIDDYADRIPGAWQRHGGVMLPIYQAEALWIDFTGSYPVAVKIAAGKINAVSGESWSPELRPGSEEEPGSGEPGSGEDPQPRQDYVVLPEQPWLDGFNVAKGRIRQFVAMPLGGGYTAEEQVTGEAEHGGLQIIAYPMKAEFYAKLLEERREEREAQMDSSFVCSYAMGPPPDMGLGLGGSMRQEIETDPHDPEVWDTEHPARCFVHLANSEQWRAITGRVPPQPPLTAEQYRAHGIPWFEHYAERGGDHPGPIDGSDTLAELDTVSELAGSTDDEFGPGFWDESIEVDEVISVGPARKVREPDPGLL